MERTSDAPPPWLQLDARQRLAEWFRQLGERGGDMPRSEACFLMVQVRHLIEAAPDPDTYRTAAFYADWTVHAALDRSAVCFEVLRDLTRVVAANFNPTDSDVTAQVSCEIGLARLRAELLALFRANNLPTTLFHYRENWRLFVGSLLWLVAGQPIAFPATRKGRAKKIYEEMMALERPHGLGVMGMMIVDREGTYYWVLNATSTDKQFFLAGQIHLGEGEDAFEPPPAELERGSPEENGEIRTAWLKRLDVLGSAQSRYLWTLLVSGLFFWAVNRRVGAGELADFQIPIIDLPVDVGMVWAIGPAVVGYLILAMVGSLHAYGVATEALGIPDGAGEAFDSNPNAIDLAIYKRRGSRGEDARRWFLLKYPLALTVFVTEVGWLLAAVAGDQCIDVAGRWLFVASGGVVLTAAIVRVGSYGGRNLFRILYGEEAHRALLRGIGPTPMGGDSRLRRWLSFDVLRAKDPESVDPSRAPLVAPASR